MKAKMIYVGERCRHPKKKPGWKEAAAQEAEWLKTVNSVKLFSTNKYKVAGTKKALPSPVVGAVKRQVVDEMQVNSVPMGTGAGTKSVPRPEITYKEDPELLARELKARERKFAVAPVYNKGPAQFLSEDMDADMKKGLLRRR